MTRPETASNRMDEAARLEKQADKLGLGEAAGLAASAFNDLDYAANLDKSRGYSTNECRSLRTAALRKIRKARHLIETA